ELGVAALHHPPKPLRGRKVLPEEGALIENRALVVAGPKRPQLVVDGGDRRLALGISSGPKRAVTVQRERSPRDVRIVVSGDPWALRNGGARRREVRSTECAARDGEVVAGKVLAPEGGGEDNQGPETGDRGQQAVASHPG